MKDDKTDVYLHLMHWAFVEIGAMSAFRLKIWNPFTWAKCVRLMWRINRLSNAMHNLPVDMKSGGLAENEEESFWKCIQNYEERFSISDECGYRNVYEDELKERKG